jgi:hypothetical protein
MREKLSIRANGNLWSRTKTAETMFAFDPHNELQEIISLRQLGSVGRNITSQQKPVYTRQNVGKVRGCNRK